MSSRHIGHFRAAWKNHTDFVLSVTGHFVLLLLSDGNADEEILMKRYRFFHVFGRRKYTFRHFDVRITRQINSYTLQGSIVFLEFTYLDSSDSVNVFYDDVLKMHHIYL